MGHLDLLKDFAKVRTLVLERGPVTQHDTGPVLGSGVVVGVNKVTIIIKKYFKLLHAQTI